MGCELPAWFQCSYSVGPGCVFPSAKTVGASTLRCGLESLRRKTSYSVQVMASTSAGGVNGTRINFKTLSISE